MNSAGRRATVLLLATAIDLLIPRITAAQWFPPRTPQPGQLLRWVTVEGQTGRGEMLEPFDPSSGRLALRLGHRFCTSFDPCAPDTLELDALRQLEVRIASGAGRGAVVGGVIGLLFGLSLSSFIDSMDDSSDSNPLAYVVWTGLSVGFFGIGGAIVGAQFETWRPVMLEE